MKKLTKIIALTLSLIMAFGLVSCDSGGNEDCESHIDENGDRICDNENCDAKVLPATGSKVGNTCPVASLTLLGSDEKVSVTDYAGKIIVLNFWGTWCGPCKAELPEFSQIASDKADEVVVLAVHSSFNSGIDPVDYVAENYSDSKIVFAQDSAMGSMEMYYTLLGGDGYYPYTVVIDSDGVITYSSSGGLSYANLESLINAAK